MSEPNKKKPNTVLVDGLPIRQRTRPTTPQTSDIEDERVAAQAALDPTSVDDDDRVAYEVGYGRPPKVTRFKPGVSGNKHGRPKGRKNASTIASQVLDRKMQVTMNGKRKKLSMLEIGIERQAQKMSEKGDQKALELLLRLAEGGSPNSSGAQFPAVGAVAQIDAGSLEILAHHHREKMTALGLGPDDIERLLDELGLVTSVEGQSV